METLTLELVGTLVNKIRFKIRQIYQGNKETYLYWYGMYQYGQEEGVPLGSDSGSSSGLSGKPGPHRWVRCGAPATAGVSDRTLRGCVDCCRSFVILSREWDR